MRKLSVLTTATLLVFFNIFNSVMAGTIYLPNSSSSQFLPTVKIMAYSLGFNGSLSPQAYGSGTLIDNKGTVLTNNHVIENTFDPTRSNDAFQICLTRGNNPDEPICNFTASLIARDPGSDLALIKIDSTDAKGNFLNFDFHMPYNNNAKVEIGKTVTIIGYPDTGGRTITFTSGLISGFLTQAGVKFIKTDADISFGNSGGTAVDADGNFIGIPTFVVSSGSSEVLGYLYPLSQAVSWIKSHINDAPTVNAVANSELRSRILSNIQANESGRYKNTYPPYEISTIEGWRFANGLEGAFESGGYASYGVDEIVIHPVNDGGVYLSLSVTDYAYEVSLEDVEYILSSYAKDFGMWNNSVFERVELNSYPAVMETYSFYDWWTGTNNYRITYYIPYGDKLINVSYNFGDGDDRVSEIESILATFKVDMSKIDFKIVNEIVSEDPKITLVNTIKNTYLSDNSYVYDGVNYFGASFGKKRDYHFTLSIYSNVYWDPSYVGKFNKFKKDTLNDAKKWYDIIANGSLRIDGHRGFFYTDAFGDFGGSTNYYTTIYLENDDQTFFTIYYSGPEKSYKGNMADFKKILKSIKLSNDGKGKYQVPNFMGAAAGGILADIKNYVYEANIRSLNKLNAFGPSAPLSFNPAGKMSRGEFVSWVTAAQNSADFLEFKAKFKGCETDCFEDVPKDSAYIYFAKEKGAIKGNLVKDKWYFYPEEQISLPAAMKILSVLAELEVWRAPEFIPWYVPYIHLAYKFQAMPYGVNDVNYLLTRGEAAFVIDTMLYAGTSNSFDFNFSF